MLAADTTATWFETRVAKFTQATYTCLRAALLTMRVSDFILRSPLQAGVSKDEATALENTLVGLVSWQR